MTKSISTGWKNWLTKITIISFPKPVTSAGGPVTGTAEPQAPAQNVVAFTWDLDDGTSQPPSTAPTAPNWTFQFNLPANLAAGSHLLTMSAYDDAGGMTLFYVDFPVSM